MDLIDNANVLIYSFRQNDLKKFLKPAGVPAC